MVLMVLMVMVAVGLMTLSSIELRKTARSEPAAEAKANARLALMQAIGQLQKTMGPDQRISATAEILRKDVKQPHWTGVWRTTLDNGDPIFTRNDLEGSLRDERWERKLNPADRVMEWLVSGKGDPSATPAADDVAIYRNDPTSAVTVPRVAVAGLTGETSGHLAWWTGDLGVRANVRTGDPREAIAANRKSPGDGGLYRVMTSQSADMKMMDGGVDLENAKLGKIVSPGMMALSGVKADWAKTHAFDFTTESSGVLADVVNDGLKQDLTAYFENGETKASGNLKGLTDDEPLVGAGSAKDAASKDSRYDSAGPRFGLLRDWARLSLPFSGKNVDGRSPDFDTSAGKDSSARALANENPVKLAGNMHAGLQPILVEATNFTQMSTYSLQAGVYQLRQLMYPRVVLWNPYNCDLKFDRSIIMIQGNGRQEMWTLNVGGSITQWLNFEGGRSTSFNGPGGIMGSSGYNDPYMGSYYFSMPATTFGPGDCLVFSPARSAEYDGLSAYRSGSYNLDSNVLSCQVSPDPSRAYYVSASDLDGGMTFLPKEFWYAPTPYIFGSGANGINFQGDDSRAILKLVGNASKVTFENFDKLPQVCVLSGSLQYGAGREPRISWNKNERMPIQMLDRFSPKPTVVPNVRTREGIRLRWFDEHPSNLGSGSLAGTSYFQDALLANWNPRASFIIRSPWENIGGIAPWFFGAYTRDLFDQAVGWDEQMPVPRNGRFHGNPFGPPQEGSSKYVLFDVPRSETGLVSLGQLQHAKLSELIWHPSYAVGNSLVDPRLGTGGVKGLNRTAAAASTSQAAKSGGFNQSEIGWPNEAQRSAGKDDWAATARAILGQVPERDNVVYDLSFEVNQKLWDRFYLSSGSPAAKREFLADPVGKPLPNGRMRLAPATRASATADGLGDFNQSARHLMVDGAFNVNSTSVEAWKALLGSTRKSGFGNGENVPFPRVLDPQDGAWKNGESADGDNVWSGYRELNVDEITRLAVAIVAEVKLRGPFLSLADFVNRRLAEDETGRMGALQAAIEKAQLNSGLTDEYPLDNGKSLPNYSHPDHLPDATRMEQTLKPASKAWGAPAYLTQADVLQVLGPALSARSDTFVIRAYGDAVDAAGKIQARAWCEAVVQRTPRPLTPDASGLNSSLVGKSNDFGREFIITSFRWLLPDEV
ncbi:MAG: hypothetical protein ABIS50_12880 [Luteolibacter sp.]|uniref:hypothetical protein n=1 Tax=Luteolibacter sp. TaxID=1962973 RepID=UPI00326439AF